MWVFHNVARLLPSSLKQGQLTVEKSLTAYPVFRGVLLSWMTIVTRRYGTSTSTWRSMKVFVAFCACLCFHRGISRCFIFCLLLHLLFLVVHPHCCKADPLYKPPNDKVSNLQFLRHPHSFSLLPMYSSLTCCVTDVLFLFNCLLSLSHHSFHSPSLKVTFMLLCILRQYNPENTQSSSLGNLVFFQSVPSLS